MRTRVLTGILPSLSTFPSCVSKMPQNQGVRPPHGHEPVSFLPHSGHNMNHINDLCRLCLGWCKGEMGPKPKHGGCVPSGGCEVYQIGYRIRLDTGSDWIQNQIGYTVSFMQHCICFDSCPRDGMMTCPGDCGIMHQYPCPLWQNATVQARPSCLSPG